MEFLQGIIHGHSPCLNQGVTVLNRTPTDNYRFSNLKTGILTAEC